MKIMNYCESGLVFAVLAIAPMSYAASNVVVPGMGHDLAQRLCTSCHLIEPGTVNAPDHVGGPAFQSVADQPKVTERSLRRHLRTTHTNAMIPLAMPNPQLSEDELIKIIGYIISLRRISSSYGGKLRCYTGVFPDAFGRDNSITRRASSVMTVRKTTGSRSEQQGMLTAVIFDVDGVLLASPHERAWREALVGFADPSCFTTAMYATYVAGKPRLSGARAALEALGVPDAARQAVAYAEHKQKRLEELIHAGSVSAFSRRASFRSSGRCTGLAHGGRIVLEECEPNDATDPSRLWPKPARCL